MLRSFLEEAQVERFSLCFNSGADGVLMPLDGWRFSRSHEAREELIDPAMKFDEVCLSMM